MKRKKKVKVVRICKRCSFLTEKKICLVCGKKTEVVQSKKIKRFPREISKDEIANKAIIEGIERKCAEFEAPGHVAAVKVGPVVTQFDFIPERFIRVKRIRGMNEDLALALGVEQVTITRIPGQSAVAIMVSNKERKPVTFDDCLKNVIKQRNKMALPMNLGVDSLGNPMVIDLAKLPHLLIGGETGAGKSVLLNGIITSLLYVRTPKQLELVLIDPKAVELLQYASLPHAVRPPVSNVYDALRELENLNNEMRRRMVNIHNKKAKNIAEYNAQMKPEDQFPHIVVVIDEMVDLMLQEKKEFTSLLAQVSSMARAAGIHIIAATQRPSVDVLTGKIKVNFPARIAFRVPSQGDSRTILSTKGAEQLLQHGDAFLISPERAGLTRIHVPMVEQKDVTKLMRLSIAVGHHLIVPADGVPKELLVEHDRLEKAAEAAEGKSAADALSLEIEEAP